MAAIENKLLKIEEKKANAHLHIFTLGEFNVIRNNIPIRTKDWGRDKTIQLLQYFVTNRHQRALHKEQIIDRLWEDADMKSGARDFKVSMHGINKALEPDRSSREDPKYITRQGASYQLIMDDVWIDSDAFEHFIAIGNNAIDEDKKISIKAFKGAIDLYGGRYLPDRLYMDWTAEERERLQVLALSAHMSLAELLLDSKPAESVRLTQQALLIDSTWEEAYRIQMEAYYKKGNRPLAIKSFRKCVAVLDKEFGIKPLPETTQLYQKITST